MILNNVSNDHLLMNAHNSYIISVSMFLSFLIIMTQNDDIMLMVLILCSMVNGIFYSGIHYKMIHAFLLLIFVLISFKLIIVIFVFFIIVFWHFIFSEVYVVINEVFFTFIFI